MTTRRNTGSRTRTPTLAHGACRGLFRVGGRGIILAVVLFSTIEIIRRNPGPISLVTPAIAGHRDDSNDDSARMQAEADKQAREQQREADRQARQQQREEERQARQQQREAEKQAREQQRQEEKQAREQQREADKQAHQQQREAEKQAREQQREIEKQNPQPVSDPSPPSQTTSGDQQPAATPAPVNSRDDDTQRPQPAPATARDDGKSETSKTADKKDDTPDSKSDSKDDPADGKDDGTADKRTATEPVITIFKPPPTIEKWLKQLTSPKTPPKPAQPVAAGVLPWSPGTTKTTAVPPQTGKAAAGKTAVGKPALVKTTAVAAVPAKPAATAPVKVAPVTTPSAKAASGGGYVQPIALPELATPDVLAVNATRQTLDRAKELGFKTRPATTFANLAFAVTSLQPPEGMSAAEARALLNRELPKGSFAPNQKYRIYRTASGTDQLKADTRPATMRPAGGPEDCNGDHCFGRTVIGWRPELHACANGVRIGIIDTSVDVTHPAFAHKKIELKHFGTDGAPLGPDWHGTGVTALLAGDASSGTPGMIPDANFYIADIFHADSDQEPASDTVSMLRAFDWLEAKGVKIINMSLSGPPDDLILKAIEKMTAKGVLFVAAAGNEGPTAGPSYPAAYDQVIAVTAVTKDLQGYRYANRGAYIDVAAPGVAIWTALPGAREGFHSGTSFATPYVTATLAALYPSLKAKTHDQALQQIAFKDLGDPGRDPIFGQGLLVAPTACSGAQVASAPAVPAARSLAPQGIGATAETLPWLGFQATGN